MIIFEGPDGCGKTTIAMKVAEALAQRGRLNRFVKYGILPPWWDYLFDYYRDMGVGVVADRFTCSEYVYGHVCRDGVNPSFDEHKQSIIARELQSIGAITVYVDTPWEMIQARCTAAGRKEAFKLEQIKRVKEMFDAIFKVTPITGICKWDGSLTMTVKGDGSRSLSDVVQFILMSYESIQASLPWWCGSTDAQGNINGMTQALIIGDQANESYRDGMFVPRAFAAGRSGEYLTRLLLEV
jgi:thymidylate kinase